MNVQMCYRWDSLNRDLAHWYSLCTITMLQARVQWNANIQLLCTWAHTQCTKTLTVHLNKHIHAHSASADFKRLIFITLRWAPQNKETFYWSSLWMCVFRGWRKKNLFIPIPSPLPSPHSWVTRVPDRRLWWEVDKSSSLFSSSKRSC